MEENFDDSVADPTYKPPSKNKRGQDVTDDEDDIGDGEPMDDGDADITPPPPPPPTISSTLPASGKIKIPMANTLGNGYKLGKICAAKLRF